MDFRSSIRRDLLLGAVALLGGLAVSPDASGAQGGGQGQQPPENLKFFPKDIPRDSLLGIMRGFTYALGVNCT